ncbi:MAG: hypothetical protein ACP5NA_07760 [Candidatus Acidulodesulfobacterium sp.]
MKPTNPNFKNQEYKIPIVIGAVGHRDIDLKNPQLYEDFVIDLIDKISKNENYKGTSLIALSALAKGADRIFAGGVLRAKIEKNIDIDLYCPLPLEKNIYIEYLKADGCSCDENIENIKPEPYPNIEIEYKRNSIEEFEYILKKSKRYYFCGYNKNISEAQLYSDNKFNNVLLEEQFTRTTKFIADSSNIMLVFWDGNKTTAKGGTYFSLAYKLNCVDDALMHDVAKDLDLNEIEYLQEKYLLNTKSHIVHILTKRKQRSDLSDDISYKEIDAIELDKESLYHQSSFFKHYNKLNKEINLDFLCRCQKNTSAGLMKHGLMHHIVNPIKSIISANDKIDNFNKKDISDIYHAIANINSEINNLKEKDINEIKKVKEDNFKTGNDDFNMIVNMFSVFDHLALKHQKKYRINMRVVLSLGILITILILLFYHLALSPYMPLALIITFSFISLAYFFYNKFTNPFDDAAKYIHYRVAAELLRLQYYFNILNIDKSMASYYSDIIEEDSKWMSHILKTAYLLNYKYKKNIEEDDLNFVIDNWINYQRDKYFDKKIKIESKTKMKFKIFQKVSIIFFFLMILSLAVFDKFYIKYNIIQGVLILSNIMFILYLNFRGYFEDSRADKLIPQYNKMKSIYSDIGLEISKLSQDKKIDKKVRDKKIKTFIYILGKESINENKSWAQYENSRSKGFKL